MNTFIKVRRKETVIGKCLEGEAMQFLGENREAMVEWLQSGDPTRRIEFFAGVAWSQLDNLWQGRVGTVLRQRVDYLLEGWYA